MAIDTGPEGADISGDEIPESVRSQQAAVAETNRAASQGSGALPEMPTIQPSAHGGGSSESGQANPPGRPPSDQMSNQDSGTGLAQGWNALTSGLQALGQNPEWMKHPLLRLFADPTSDPGQMGQDIWGATRWFGNAIGSAFDAEGIHQSVYNIEHDRGISGFIGQNLLNMKDNPIDNFMWNLIPHALTAAAEWEPWMWVPQMAASGPDKLQNLPGAVAGLFGNDLKHPKFTSPEWYAHMTTYALAATIAAKTGGKGAQPILELMSKEPRLAAIGEGLQRMFLGQRGPIEQISRMPGLPSQGQMPNPREEALQSYGQDLIKRVQSGESILRSAFRQGGQGAERTLEQLPGGEFVVRGLGGAERKTLDNLNRKLGKSISTASPEAARQGLFEAISAGDISAQQAKYIAKNWQQISRATGITHDLKLWHPAEAAHNDLQTSFSAIAEGTKEHATATALRASLHGLYTHYQTGIHEFAGDGSLVGTLVRGFLGVNTHGSHHATDVAEHIASLLGGDGRKAMDVIESGMKGYEELAPHQKFAVDAARAALAWRGEEARRWDLIKGRQPNYVPHVRARQPAPLLDSLDPKLRGAISDLARKAQTGLRMGRTERGMRAFNLALRETEQAAEPEVFARAAYNNVHEANASLGKARSRLRDDLVREAESNPKLREFMNQDGAIEQILEHELPRFETDLGKVLKSSLLQDTRTLLSQKLLKTASYSLVMDELGRAHPLVLQRGNKGALTPANPFLAKHFNLLDVGDRARFYSRELEYQALNAPGFQGLLFHPSLAGPLNRAMEMGRGNEGRAYKALLKVARVGQKAVMLNPLWHETNLLGREAKATIYNLMHGTSMESVMPGWGKLSGEERQHFWESMDNLFLRSGGVPPRMHTEAVGELQNLHMNATNDLDMGESMVPQVVGAGRSIPSPIAKAIGAGKGASDWWDSHVSAGLWQHAHQIGTYAFALERQSALARGVSEGEANLIAASRANAWMGSVNPYEWMNSSLLSKIAPLAMFAPSWWRTLPRVLTGSFNRYGLKDTDVANLWAQNSTRALATTMIFKAGSDNLLNLLLAGQFQFQNPDGYKNSVIMTPHSPVGGALNALPGNFGSFADRDPNTGAQMVVENPFARQISTLEDAMGLTNLLDGHPKGSGGDWAAQAAAAVASRQSVLASAAEAAANFDLYQFVKTGGRGGLIDPAHHLFESTAAAADAIMQFSPLAFTARDFIQNLSQQGGSGQPAKITEGPFAGSTLPGWATSLWDLSHPLLPLTQLFGVRTPHRSPIKTSGEQVTSLQHMQAQQAIQQHDDLLNELDKASVSGGRPLSDLVNDYYTQSDSYHARLDQIYGGAPEYTQGVGGMLAAYENLYNDPKVKDPVTGDVNFVALERAQAQLEHSDPATYKLMQAKLRQNDLQHPFLAVYHSSLNHYRDFQSQWAREKGMDPGQLRELVNQAHGLSTAEYRVFERDHPEYAQWQAAKKKWELSDNWGFMYGMFSGSSYVMRYVDAKSGGTPQGAAQYEQGQFQQLLPTAEQEAQSGQGAQQS